MLKVFGNRLELLDLKEIKNHRKKIHELGLMVSVSRTFEGDSITSSDDLSSFCSILMLTNRCLVITSDTAVLIPKLRIRLLVMNEKGLKFIENLFQSHQTKKK